MGYLPQHPRFLGLYDVQEHQQGVEHVVPALEPQKKRQRFRNQNDSKPQNLALFKG